MVGSNVVSDARVRKGATSLQQAGFEVRILFTTKEGGDFPSELDGISIEHLTTPELDVAKPPNGARRIATIIRSRGGFSTNAKRRSAIHRNKLRDRETATQISRRKAALRDRGMSPSPQRRFASRLFGTFTRGAIRADRARLKLRRRFLGYRLNRTSQTAAPGPFLADDVGRLHRRHVRANWRERLPDLAAMELVFGPRIDALAPDILHVHDYHLLPTAAEAAIRAKVAGRDLHVIYDAHEFVRGLTTLRNERRIALAGMEARFIPHADAVITVSQPLASKLATNHRISVPSVVLNAPRRHVQSHEPSALRTRCELPPEAPLLVYSGNVTPARGVHTLVEAMSLFDPDVHVALIVGARVRYVDELIARAAELGVVDRLHLAPYVEVDRVAHYLRDASVGIHPMLHYPNAEIALPNKLFEYAQARIPVVVSDCAAQRDFVERLQIGRAFRAGDPSDLADKVRKVLDDPEPYRRALTDSVLDELSWEGQEPTLLGVYKRLTASTRRP